jgi:nucleotide-binding universal stress UspA family protein
MNLKLILVATDASAASNRALEMAVQIAGQHDAELLIVHVIRDMQIPFEIKEIPELEFNKFESFNDAREEIMRKIAETVLRTAKEKAQKAGADKVQTAIGTGDPATGILDFARRREVDMIVVGTRGLGKLKGTILGSVSRKVVNNAETTCLIVR